MSALELSGPLAPPRRGLDARALARRAALPALVGLCVASAAWSLTTGALAIPASHLVELVAGRCGEAGAACTAQQEAVIMAIRAPRVALGLITGAALGCAGAALQGIFRNRSPIRASSACRAAR